MEEHKATIAVCVAEAGREGDVLFVGGIPNTPAAHRAHRSKGCVRPA